jgi:3-hydroxybutyryl-CoA dehydrogenase
MQDAAIVGTGTMGMGFSHVLSQGGLRCWIADASPELASAARDRAITQARRYAEIGLMPADAADITADRVIACNSIEDAVSEADVVLEAVPEDPAIKHAVLGRIEAVSRPTAIVASNTSAIPITRLAEPLHRPGQFLGAHWFNPPQWIPCVELIPTERTDPATVENLADLLRAVGKQPSIVRDSAGFVANRIQFAMFKEAVAVVADGIASAEEVDEIVRGSFGFRLPFFGPFAIGDMAGLDVYLGAYQALAAAHGERFEAPELIRQLVAAGRLGHKAGQGILASPDDPAGVAERRDRLYAALGHLVAEQTDR